MGEIAALVGLWGVGVEGGDSVAEVVLELLMVLPLPLKCMLHFPEILFFIFSDLVQFKYLVCVSVCLLNTEDWT